MSRVSKALSTWESLVEALPTMTEQQLAVALQTESRKPIGERRLDIIRRLHRRYTRIRKERELQEYLS